jgi:hypothetical protein
MWWLIVAAAVLLLINREMGYAIKPGVWGTMRDEMLPALSAVQRVWNAHGLGTPVITSIQDGAHMRQSKHNIGLAHDYRLNNLNRDLHELLAVEVAALLGEDFDVIHEYHGTANDHLHVEFDPD